MKIGTGIAIAGIWIGIGITSFNASNTISSIALYGTIGSCIIAFLDATS